MKTKVIVLAFIFMLSFLSISCTQDGNPFTTAPDVEEQSSEVVNTGSVASTGFYSNVSRSAKSEEKGSYQKPKFDIKGKPRTNHKAFIDQVAEASTEKEVSNATVNNVTAIHNPKLKTKAGSNKGPSKGSKNNNETTQELRAQVKPFKWNINWANSMGLVTVRINGEGFEEINPETIKMVGPEGAETGAPSKAQVGPYSVVAKFLKSEAIGIIPEPQRGVSYDIQVMGQFNDGTEFDPPIANIIVVGKKYLAGDLSLVIRPKKWNIAWGNDEGDNDGENVIARISGEGFEDIDPTTVQMAYPDGGLPSISPIPDSYEFGGVSFVTKFNQSDAIGLILDPKRGDNCTILVTGNLSGGTPFEVWGTITISGKKFDQGLLTLEIKPTKWNTAWAENGDGEVTARIKGEGFEDIVYSSLWMVGPGGSVQPDDYEIGGFTYIANFSQSKAISIIPNPKNGESHTIHLTGSLSDGTTFNLPDTITINGKKK